MDGHLTGSRSATILARPPAHRLATKPPPAPRVAPAPDLPAVVAELRRRPVAEPRPADHPPLAPASAPPPRLTSLRPAEIVKGPRAVRSLLAQACEEYWVVRLSYVDGDGRSSELTAEPTDLDGHHLHAICFPRGDERSFVVDRIDWVRVLTEAEEAYLS